MAKSIISPFKPCAKCGTMYPNTREYFSPTHTRKDGSRTLSATCKPCAAAKMREYYAAHPEYRQKAKEHRQRQLESGYFAEYQARNRERLSLQRKERYYADIEASRQRRREAFHRYKVRHPERLRLSRQACAAKRNKKKFKSSLTTADIQSQLDRQNGRCYYCNARVLGSFHVDHVIPLSRGGKHTKENIVIACPICNMSKGSKMPHEWAQGGKLL